MGDLQFAGAGQELPCFASHRVGDALERHLPKLHNAITSVRRESTNTDTNCAHANERGHAEQRQNRTTFVFGRWSAHERRRAFHSGSNLASRRSLAASSSSLPLQDKKRISNVNRVKKVKKVTRGGRREPEVNGAGKAEAVQR